MWLHDPWYHCGEVPTLPALAQLKYRASTDCPASSGSCIEEWAGTRAARGKLQSFVLHVIWSASGNQAKVDLPDFGALDIPASRFSLENGGIHFELVGDSETAIFDGSISGESIHGQWKENDLSGGFELNRVSETGKAFREEEVSFTNGGVRLAGTFLLPLRLGPAPAIVFVHGSGPEKRYTSKFLAEFFVKRGIAALIYDKRGSGNSSGDWKRSSFEDLAGDVTAAVTFLKSRPEVDAARIGLMGSSQGGWIAPMAALHIPDLAFLIVKSAAAVSPEKQELARVQIEMKAEGDSLNDITQALALYRHAIAYARTGKDWHALENEIAAASHKRWAIFDRELRRIIGSSIKFGFASITIRSPSCNK